MSEITICRCIVCMAAGKPEQGFIPLSEANVVELIGYHMQSGKMIKEKTFLCNQHYKQIKQNEQN